MKFYLNFMFCIISVRQRDNECLLADDLSIFVRALSSILIDKNMVFMTDLFNGCNCFNLLWLNSYSTYISFYYTLKIILILCHIFFCQI